MATEKQVKQAIKQVLDSEYMNKMVTFDKNWKFKVKSYNIRTRSRFIPKDERDDYGCDVDANKFFIIEFNNAKDEMDATDAADHGLPCTMRSSFNIKQAQIILAGHRLCSHKRPKCYY